MNRVYQQIPSETLVNKVTKTLTLKTRSLVVAFFGDSLVMTLSFTSLGTIVVCVALLTDCHLGYSTALKVEFLSRDM